jgi:large subunit ribosomal protein L16
MSLMPKRTKYRKQHRGRLNGMATRGNTVSFGDFGLQSLDWGWVTGRQLEAARVAANRASGGQAKVYIRVFPHKPVSGKPAETRMGTGKGDVEYWTACVRPGTVLFEIAGVGEERAKLAFKRAAHKVPIKVKMIRRLPTT